MYRWGHRPIKAAILLWSALHKAARRGEMMTWNISEKSMYDVFEVILVRTELQWAWVRVKTPRWALGEIHGGSGGVEPNCADEKVEWHTWRSAGDCSGCSYPAPGSHGVTRQLCFLERAKEPRYGSHWGKCNFSFLGFGAQGNILC
jgi:hypothetical protein